MDAFIKIAGAVMAGITLIVIFGLILALPVMWLWNGCLVPAVSGVHEIGWLQAWGIAVLCGILFKSSSSND